MFQLTPTTIKRFQDKILLWYEAHKRGLPWRQSRDPYRILVSEVMLQQTQVSRVVPKFEAWMEQFPTIQDLAKAPLPDVLRLWSGLGYNRRAVYLKEAAEVIVRDFGGEFSQDEKTLRSLPGIGEYTAQAILCFAFDNQIAVVDTNVRRVILTQFQMSNVKTQISNEKEIRSIAEQLLPIGKAYEWNQALMDYAAAELQGHTIPIPKQSKFAGSDRYYRGQIVKYLLGKKETTVNELAAHLGIETEKTTTILNALVRDRILALESDTVQLQT